MSGACNDGLKYRVDCGRYGMVCDTRDMCVLPRAAGKSCDSTKFVGACDAGAHVLLVRQQGQLGGGARARLCRLRPGLRAALLW